MKHISERQSSLEIQGNEAGKTFKSIARETRIGPDIKSRLDAEHSPNGEHDARA